MKVCDDGGRGSLRAVAKKNQFDGGGGRMGGYRRQGLHDLTIIPAVGVDGAGDDNPEGRSGYCAFVPGIKAGRQEDHGRSGQPLTQLVSHSGEKNMIVADPAAEEIFGERLGAVAE